MSLAGSVCSTASPSECNSRANGHPYVTIARRFFIISKCLSLRCLAPYSGSFFFTCSLAKINLPNTLIISSVCNSYLGKYFVLPVKPHLPQLCRRNYPPIDKNESCRSYKGTFRWVSKLARQPAETSPPTLEHFQNATGIITILCTHYPTGDSRDRIWHFNDRLLASCKEQNFLHLLFVSLVHFSRFRVYPILELLYP